MPARDAQSFSLMAVEYYIPVADRLGYRYELRVERPEDGGFFLLARDARDGTRAGRLTALRQEDGSLLLADVLVEDAARPRPRRWWQRLLARLGRRRPRAVNYRRRGLGGVVLDRFLAEADACGVEVIRGSLAKGDLIAWAGLADWYRARGFRVLAAPQSWTIPGAIHALERTKDRVESPQAI